MAVGAQIRLARRAGNRASARPAARRVVGRIGSSRSSAASATIGRARRRRTASPADQVLNARYRGSWTNSAGSPRYVRPRPAPGASRASRPRGGRRRGTRRGLPGSASGAAQGRMAGKLGDGIDEAVGVPPLRFPPWFRGRGGRRGGDFRQQDLAFLTRETLSAKGPSFAHSAARNPLGEAAPFALVLDGNDDPSAVGGGKRFIGHDRGMAQPDPLAGRRNRGAAAAPPSTGYAVEQRNLDGFLPVWRGGSAFEDRGGRMPAAISQTEADPRRRLGPAGDGRQPAFRLTSMS